ncbi:putative membrane protein [Synechococcus sp. Minos11]|nr:putative membrane protein [Synechococcus sp. Minos11]
MGGAFLSAAAWGDEQSNQVLALMIGLGLVGAGLLAQFIPTPPPEKDEAQG